MMGIWLTIIIIINNDINSWNKKVIKNGKGKVVLKEDRQAFGTTIGKALILEEAFQYLNSFNALNFFFIGTLDGDLEQSKKNTFRTFFIKNSNTTTYSLP